MFCFEEYGYLISSELATMIVSQATSKNEDYTGAGLDATIPLPRKSTGTATTKILNIGDETTKYVQVGRQHLDRARGHIDQGMISLGQVLKMIQAAKPNATADDVSKAISAISMGIGGDLQSARKHPMQRLLRVSDELEDLIQMLKTAERQVTSRIRP